MWQPFSLTRKVSKGKEYKVATAVQNLLTKLYKDYGYLNSSSHAKAPHNYCYIPIGAVNDCNYQNVTKAA